MVAPLRRSSAEARTGGGRSRSAIATPPTLGPRRVHGSRDHEGPIGVMRSASSATHFYQLSSTGRREVLVDRAWLNTVGKRRRTSIGGARRSRALSTCFSERGYDGATLRGLTAAIGSIARGASTPRSSLKETCSAKPSNCTPIRRAGPTGEGLRLQGARGRRGSAAQRPHISPCRAAGRCLALLSSVGYTRPRRTHEVLQSVAIGRDPDPKTVRSAGR